MGLDSGQLVELVDRMMMQPAGRHEAAAALARRLGAEELLLFIRDDEVETLLPVPGLPQTLPRGGAWGAFLAACTRSGYHMGELPSPVTGIRQLAIGVATSDVALVLCGGSPRRELVDALVPLLPLLGAAVRGERAVLAAEAHAAVADEAATNAKTLAASLDAARGDLQRVLADAREQTQIHVDLNAALRTLDVERAQIEHQLRARVRQHELSADVGSILTSGDPLQTKLQRCAEAVVHHLDVAFARVWTLDMGANELQLRASAGLYTHLDGPHSNIPVGQLKIGLIAHERKPLLTNTVVGDPRVSDQEWARREGITAFAGYPLIVDDQVVGVLGMFAFHALEDFTTTALAAVANGIAVAIVQASTEARRSELLMKLDRHTVQLRKLAAASLAIAATTGLETLLQAITDRARDIVGAHQAMTSLVIDHDWARALSAVSLSDTYVEHQATITPPDGSGIYRLVFSENCPCRMTQAALMDDPARRGAGVDDAPMRGWLAAPLIARDGGNLGLLQLADKEMGEFTEEDEAMLVQLAQMASASIENQRLYHEAREALRTRDEFLAAAAHDLKTPLTSIKIVAQLLRRSSARADPEHTERLATGLATIEAATTQMATQIDELMDLTQIQSGQSLDLHRSRLDMVALARRVVAEQQQTTERHPIRVETSLPELIGLWDAVRVARVLQNLLSNAIKYSPQGGNITVMVGHQVDSTGAWAILGVRDQGMGIPTVDLPRIFERFQRAGNVVGRFRGTGIGLASARIIVEQHGGSISVESQEGAGSTFVVRLPLDLEHGEPEQAQP